MAKVKRRRGSIGYLTKEGIKNVWLNRLMSVASISVLLACLVMMGIAYMLVVNMEAIIDDIQAANVIMAFIDDGADSEKIRNVEKDLMKIDNVKKCTFVSKEEAFREQIEKIGEDKKVIFDGMENPLPDAYKVELKDLEQFDVTLEEIRNVQGIQAIQENRELSMQVAKIRETVTYISVGVILILLIVSRRLEIKIMNSVGATSWFIRWPFMVEGMLLGIIAGGISLGLVWGVYELVARSIGDSLGLFMSNGPVQFTDHVFVLLIAFIAVGIITGAFGSAVSIGKYLKEQEYDPDEE